MIQFTKILSKLRTFSKKRLDCILSTPPSLPPCLLLHVSTMSCVSHLQRLLQVEGSQDRRNDIIYHPANPATNQNLDPGSYASQENGAPAPGSVVYFGGDVQDLPEVQATHRDNSRYMHWNLEATTNLLAKSFPAKHILVIRPKRMELKTFSCFDNFVKSDGVGSPDYNKDHGALQHLDKLMQNVAERVSVSSDQLAPVTLVGFSKGVVVLNQIIHELPQPGNCDLVKISRMYWLDGGHNGGRETWITDKSLLSALATSGIQVRVRVTPYQVRDMRRPWIKKEEKVFSQTLAKLGANIQRKLYFEEEEVCIENHFRILTTLNDD